MKYFIFFFLSVVILLTVYSVNVYLYPSRSQIYHKYFFESTGASVEEVEVVYESFISDFDIKNPVLLDHYFIYLIDNKKDTFWLDDYIRLRLLSTENLFKEHDSFIKLLAVAVMWDRSTPDPKLASDTINAIDISRKNSIPNKNDIWHWYFQYSWGVPGYYFNEKFDELYKSKLNSDDYKPLIEVLSRSAHGSYHDYLYPILNFSFIGLETPYTDVVSKDAHNFLYSRRVRRRLTENILLFRNDQEYVLESLKDISSWSNKIWINYRAN
jgi:hypothetical protein